MRAVYQCPDPARSAALIFVLLSACTKGSVDLDTDADTVDTVETDTFDETACFSETSWTRGDRGSPIMHPGRDCIDCHGREDGPTFEAAGTVFTGLHEPDDCNGQKGITVELTDADGDVHTAKTNAAGNFYFDSRTNIAFPYTARIVDSWGVEGVMATHQDEGACNSCHTVDGENDAPGRIRLR